MSDNRAEKVAFIFEECIEIDDPLKQAAYLDSACAGSEDLRREVERLLRAHGSSGKFLMGGTPPHLSLEDEDGDVDREMGAGNRVGPYRIIGHIGEGSTSTVFLAEQEEPVRRWVALKVVKPGMDTRKVILRFSLERQALALMDHPGIAKLFDAGATKSGRPFFVMELVSGLSITQFCDEQRMTVADRLTLFSQVCEAVLHAHQRGILHRDLKPDNVLVSGTDENPSLKIIDFGIAKVLHAWGVENTTRTTMLPFLGTPAYMSPEQVSMDGSDLDTRTDIYSLGALLYELLVGHPPFDHETLMKGGLEEMLETIRKQDPLAPSCRFSRLPESEQQAVAEARRTTPAELMRTLRGDLDWITLKALEKQRERRYASADGLTKDITCHFEHRPVSAAAPSRKYRLVKLIKRNRRLVTATSLAFALLLVTTVLVSFSAHNARDMEQVASQAERQSHQAMVAMHVSSGMTAAEDMSYDRAVLWFANAARLAGEGNYQQEVNTRRATAWLSKVSVPIGAFKLDSTFRQFEFSRDSRYLLAVGTDNNWQLWDARIQEPVPLAVDIPEVRVGAWSPEGNRLVLVEPDGRVQVLDVGAGRILQDFRIDPVPSSVGFMPESPFVVFGNDALHVLDLKTGILHENLGFGEAPLVELAFAGDGNRFIGGSSADLAQVMEIKGGIPWDVSGGQVFPHRHAIRVDSCTSKSNYREEFLEEPVLAEPALALGGTRLLTRTGTYEITLWDAGTGEALQRVEDVCCSCRFITCPRADLMACGLHGGKVGIWDIATGMPRQLLPSRGACVLDIAFGHEGRYLISADANGMARLWSIENAMQIQSPLHHCTDVDRVAFARDGKRVATSQSDGLVRIWEVLDFAPDEHHEATGEYPTYVRMNRQRDKFVLTREPSWDPCRDACLSRVTVYSAADGMAEGPSVLFKGCVEAASFSPDSGILAVGVGQPGGSAPGHVGLYETGTMKRIGDGLELPSGPGSMAWSPDGTRIAVICRTGELCVFRPDESPEVEWTSAPVIPKSRINPMTFFTGDGRLLVCLDSDGRIYVREATNGQLVYAPLSDDPEGFWSITLSPDSRILASTTTSGKVILWDLDQGVRLGKPMEHPAWVYHSHFSPDQSLLATASHDGKVRIWDCRKGEPVSGPLAHPNEVYDAVFTPDNRWILTACRDGNVRIWEPGSGQLLGPPVHVGTQVFNVEITADGDHVVAGTLGKDTPILDLASLLQESTISGDDLLLLGEVVSSCTVEQGAIRDLTTSEWLERYERLRQLNPGLLRLSANREPHPLHIDKAGQAGVLPAASPVQAAVPAAEAGNPCLACGKCSRSD